MNELLRFLRGNVLAVLGAVLLGLIVLAIALGPMLVVSPTRLAVLDKLEPPSFEHLLGTDAFGRDVFSRVVHGGRATLAIGLGVVAIAFAVGAFVGIIAGYLGGVVDAVLMRLVDAILSFPALVLAIALAAMFGPSLENAMMAVAITLAPQFARVARSQALAVTARPYVEAAVSMGFSTPRILWSYVFANSIGPLLVQASLSIGSAILQTASLGFLGLGAQPPAPEWGADVSANLSFLRASPWAALSPGLAILLAVLSFNLIGDALADWFNPRRRREVG